MRYWMAVLVMLFYMLGILMVGWIRALRLPDPHWSNRITAAIATIVLPCLVVYLYHSVSAWNAPLGVDLVVTVLLLVGFLLYVAFRLQQDLRAARTTSIDDARHSQ